MTGFGGTTQQASAEKMEILKAARQALSETEEGARELVIRFDASTSTFLPWQFKPSQRTIKVAVGDTALAFFLAKNISDKPLVGVATYNVIPDRAGLYFNKIQCFCFDEQRLGPKEEMEMPVFFFIDPKINEDRHLDNVREIVLSYTFFKSDDFDLDDDEDDDE